ncbi:MAG: nucleotidyltransferase domain-containing protein [Planctomycetaceae bacterium]|nr:nucleotidyltransferase domain-containing protein [Planctomycetaceae bacterium]
MIHLDTWKDFTASLDVRPLFVTVSGAHLYGFESPDSDVDLRGCHLLPLREVIGLRPANETLERSGIHAGVEVDLVSHDLGKYLNLLVKNNGYVLEQIFSPLVVTGQEFLDRLRPIARRCITRFHYFHYRGFFATQRKLLEKEDPKRAKSLLYAYRVLLTGINLLTSGEVEANLRVLNDRFQLPYIEELIAAKVAEKVGMPSLDWSLHDAELQRLERELESAFAASPLGEERDLDAVNNLLVEQRLAGLHAI